jgi:hypothetical protein
VATSIELSHLWSRLICFLANFVLTSTGLEKSFPTQRLGNGIGWCARRDSNSGPNAPEDLKSQEQTTYRVGDGE